MPPETAELEPVAVPEYRNIDPAFMRENIARIRFAPSFSPMSEDTSYDTVRTIMEQYFDMDDFPLQDLHETISHQASLQSVNNALPEYEY